MPINCRQVNQGFHLSTGFRLQCSRRVSNRNAHCMGAEHYDSDPIQSGTMLSLDTSGII